MARKKRSAAPFQEPPRVPRGYTGSSATGARPLARDATDAVVDEAALADLPKQYAHVKKDLARIAVLGGLMFVLIYVSTLFLL